MRMGFEEFEDKVAFIKAKYALCECEVAIAPTHLHSAYTFFITVWSKGFKMSGWSCSIHADADWPGMLDNMLNIIVKCANNGGAAHNRVAPLLAKEHVRTMEKYHGTDSQSRDQVRRPLAAPSTGH